jgi:nucleotide-binding universal stress UspA family protein
MSQLKKVLCPVNLADESLAPAQEAASLAKALGGELVLLHVMGEPAFALGDPMLAPADVGGYALPALAEEYRSEMDRRLHRLGDKIRALGLPVTTLLVRGPTHEAIVRTADEQHADLIVMGTHGRTGLQHVLLGSVAERVVRTAKMPVMTLRMH